MTTYTWGAHGIDWCGLVFILAVAGYMCWQTRGIRK